jgi:2-polyprenyl-6-methoxyphenol hydroxylase-like FAD-dependent oxidoreductase
LTRVDRVLVVGAGIAGVALARVLHQRGVPAMVFDRMAGPPDARLGVNLPGNGVRALGLTGVADGLATLGQPVRRREYRSAKGRLLFAVDEDEFWGDCARSRCVRRGDLLDLLAEGLPEGTIRWNAPVTATRQTPQGVELDLADGTTETGGFAVGADGVHSVVRKATLGDDGLRTALLSAASWRFSAPNPGVDCWVVWSGAQGSFLLIPVGTGEVYGYASATQGGPVDPDPSWLRSTFGHFPAPVPEVVASALALYHSPVEEVRVPSWHQGRVVLIGDAAHATAPVWAQGAALAVEDALVLADLLAARPDWDAVGAEYERRRRPRVAHVQAMTDRFSRAAGLPTWFRDTILPVIGPRTYRAAYAPLRTPVAG